MLNVKKLLTKLSDRTLIRTTDSFTVPALSAGAKGYWTIPVSATGIVTSVLLTTSNIAVSGGLQLTYVAASSGTLYVNYYAPTAISANTVTLNVIVYSYTSN